MAMKSRVDDEAKELNRQTREVRFREPFGDGYRERDGYRDREGNVCRLSQVLRAVRADALQHSPNKKRDCLPACATNAVWLWHFLRVCVCVCKR